MNDVQMKGITCCADCAYYSMKKHKCIRGHNEEGKATDHFYKDCPLPDVRPMARGKWTYSMWFLTCSNCGMTMADTDDDGDKIPTNFCPNCGADMRTSEEPESLTYIPPEERSGVDDG